MSPYREGRGERPSPLVLAWCVLLLGDDGEDAGAPVGEVSRKAGIRKRRCWLFGQGCRSRSRTCLRMYSEASQIWPLDHGAAK
jgi:hypothetical protein